MIKRSAILFYPLLLSLFSLTLFASGDEQSARLHQEGKKSIKIEFDYGGLRPSRAVVTEYDEGMSAMKLLQQVAEVQTYQLGMSVFVKSIDKVKSERGKMGWFYSIDGVSAKKLASSYLLKDAHEMKWSYRVEACY
jgi:hypothetical protein